MKKILLILFCMPLFVVGQGWNQLGFDIDGESVEDRSGHAVAINGDGSIVAIGALSDGLTLGVNSLPFDRYYLTAIIGCAEIPVRALNQPLLGSALGRKYGILLLLSLLASASITAMFWSTDFGRT